MNIAQIIPNETPVDITKFANEIGINVSYATFTEELKDKCRGRFEKGNDRIGIIINKDDPPNIQRLTIARLIAYNFINSKTIGDNAVIADMYPSAKLRNEQKVMDMALCIIMPELALRYAIRNVPKMNNPESVATHFKVPVYAANRRIDLTPERVENLIAGKEKDEPRSIYRETRIKARTRIRPATALDPLFSIPAH